MPLPYPRFAARPIAAALADTPVVLVNGPRQSAQATQLANFTQVGGALGLDDKTTRRYLGLLEQVFLVQRLEPWFANELKHLVRTPKLHFLGSGLLAALQGATAERLDSDRTRLGPLLETFVFAELLKQAGWSEDRPRPSFYRTRDGELALSFGERLWAAPIGCLYGN